ncbi:MAG: hypothetical protein RMJ51_01330 [Candidatus Calescibacterium sp.]|nr:hypothetical protein [Candidatus Calescibacterium sp.]MCX7972183.1 hypothetical protein [bacterium]MDW8194873.1 hypothetical protein [Candidatus Calescibacterium sp.]
MIMKIIFLIFIVMSIILTFANVERKVLYNPSIEVINNSLDLDGQYLVAGNIKGYTETSDDWIFVITNPDLSISRISILSGEFSDRLVNVALVEDSIVGIGDTWSFRRESLDDILVSYFDRKLDMKGYYVVSGIRDDRASKIVRWGNKYYFLGSTRSVGFGANSTLIFSFDTNFYPSSFWVIGSSVDQETFDLIELSPTKALLVAGYQKIPGNKDCLIAIVDNEFYISRAFAFGGGFDENIVDIIKDKDRFYFIFESRSFKPHDKTNILISAYNRSNLSHIRSFSFGTTEEDKYLSAYKQGENIFIFFSTLINKSPVLAVAVLDEKMGLKGVHNLNEFFEINTQVSGLKRLKNDLWVLNLFNINTLEDISFFRTTDVFNYLLKAGSKGKGESKQMSEDIKIQKYYLKIARYPNIESYPVEIRSRQISSDNFIVTNEIKLNYFDVP